MELSLAPFEIGVKISTLFIGNRAGSLLGEEKLQMASKNMANGVYFPRPDPRIAWMKSTQLSMALPITASFL